MLFKFLKKRIDKRISDSLYEDYLRTCRYTGELPLNKEAYEKRIFEYYETEEEYVEKLNSTTNRTTF